MKNLAIALLAVLLLCLLAAAAGAEPSHCPYDIHLSIVYNHLTASERTLYDRLYDALYTGQESVLVPSDLSWGQTAWIADFICNEAPELCAYDGGASKIEFGTGFMTISLKYRMPLSEQERFIQDAAETARRYAGKGEKKGLKAIHDDLCKRFEYGYSAEGDTQLAYYALKLNRAVCNGYAQAFVMYAHFAGFPCSYVNGDGYYEDGTKGAGSHSWNIACANGKYFWLDTTWDDEGNKAGKTWYGLDGESMFRTHVPKREYKPILDLKTVLPKNVTHTQHLDVNNSAGYTRGITQKSGKTVQLRKLKSGEYYSPAMVVSNNGRSRVSVSISCRVDGELIDWGRWPIEPGSGLAYRTDASQLRGRTGNHEAIWYCDGIRIASFTWKVK
ncbi:MAG: hypothetical protein IKE30_04370 [Clostridia bacterium]|nr:hypothetical protein [Clostridia bacterium]